MAGSSQESRSKSSSSPFSRSPSLTVTQWGEELRCDTLLIIAMAASISLAASFAHASPVLDHILATNTPDGTVSLNLPSMPVPSSYTPTSFTLDGVTIDDDGTIVSADVTFFNALGGGGGAGEGYKIGGDVLFSGITSAPTLNIGTFNVARFPVTITSPAPIPEPSSLLLLLSGALGGIQAVRRRIAR